MIFEFIDLFSGIGGTRLGFERAGGKCVFSSEVDKFARMTYLENFGDVPYGDLFKFNAEDIPDHDILVAGFPCQPFSLAGVAKRNSLHRAHGFKCKSKGQLFFKIIDILNSKKPSAFFLENVKHLLFHNNGETFNIIKKNLNASGYDINYKIINSRNVVPQNRKRIYIVGFQKKLNRNFLFPDFDDFNPKMKDILSDEVDPKYTLSDKLWKYLQAYRRKQQLKGNGFGYSLVDPEGISRTLSARYYKDGSEILIPQEGKNPRRLTPDECSELMGFPQTFKMPVSDTQAYKQFGNSVVVPIVEKIAKTMVECLIDGKQQCQTLEIPTFH